MKVELAIRLDLPDECSKMSDDEISQIIYDNYVNYATCSHLKDSAKWCARGRIGSEDEDVSAKRIYVVHRNWGEICSNASWSMRRIDDKTKLDHGGS